MIKSVRIEARQNQTDRWIAQKTSALKGQNLFGVSTGNIEKQLLKELPQIQTLDCGRIFPDQLRIRYSLRQPVAFLDGMSGAAQVRAVDSQGVVFTMPVSEIAANSNHPELVFSSTASLQIAVAFLNFWNQAETAAPAQIQRLSIDQWSELTFLTSATPSVQVVWGYFSPRTFKDKIERFRHVWLDLESNQIQAEAINLRDVPQHKKLPDGASEIVGRVFVKK